MLPSSFECSQVQVDVVSLVSFPFSQSPGGAFGSLVVSTRPSPTSFVNISICTQLLHNIYPRNTEKLIMTKQRPIGTNL